MANRSSSSKKQEDKMDKMKKKRHFSFNLFIYGFSFGKVMEWHVRDTLDASKIRLFESNNKMKYCSSPTSMTTITTITMTYLIFFLDFLEICLSVDSKFQSKSRRYTNISHFFSFPFCMYNVI